MTERSPPPDDARIASYFGIAAREGTSFAGADLEDEVEMGMVRDASVEYFGTSVPLSFC
jgi:hypothetical protein